MQRDMDLVRAILLAIEAHPDPALPSHPLISGWSDKQVTYHLGLLYEAELIGVATTFQGDDAVLFVGISLRWSGHEFLAAARDDGRWKKAKAALGGAFNAVTLKVLQDLLVAYVRSVVGLP